jgi:hypothetical protein
MTPKDVQGLTEFLRKRGAVEGAYDIVVGGHQRGKDWDAERRHVRAVADAGATWWTEWIAPADRAKMRAAIERGPLRVE